MEIKVLYYPVKTSEEYKYGYIAVAHIRIHVFGRKHNLETAKKFIILASKYNARILVYPYMQPHGPIIDYIHFKKSIERYSAHEIKRIIRGSAVSLQGGYLYNLWITGKNHGVDLLIPGVLETAGKRLYVSGIALPGVIGSRIHVTRRTVIRDHDPEYGVYRSKEINVLELPELNVGVFMDNEILYPEILRILKFKGAAFYVYGMSQVEPVKNYTILLKSLSLMFKAWVIHPGSVICDKDSCSWRTSTVIVDDRGEAFEYNGIEQALILIPLYNINPYPVLDEYSRIIAKLYYRHILKTTVHKHKVV